MLNYLLLPVWFPQHTKYEFFLVGSETLVLLIHCYFSEGTERDCVLWSLCLHWARLLPWIIHLTDFTPLTLQLLITEWKSSNVLIILNYLWIIMDIFCLQIVGNIMNIQKFKYELHKSCGIDSFSYEDLYCNKEYGLNYTLTICIIV